MHISTQFLRDKNKENTSTNKKRIIFLDIDGVLQPYNNQFRFDHNMEQTIDYLCNKYHTQIYKEIDIYDVNAAYYDWDDEAIGILKKLLYSINAYIVLHTSWKDYMSYEQIKSIFALYDMDDRIIDVTKGKDKILGIQTYLQEHNEDIESYVVIDDADFSDEFGPYFVRTKNILTRENAELCKTILLSRYTIEQTYDDFYKTSSIAIRFNHVKEPYIVVNYDETKIDDKLILYDAIITNNHKYFTHIYVALVIKWLMYHRQNDEKFLGIRIITDTQEIVEFLRKNYIGDISKIGEHKWEIIEYKNTKDNRRLLYNT